MENGIFCDSHVHMAEEGFGNGYPDLEDVGLLVTCTAKPDEWKAQSGIADGRAVKSYGVHPWYCGMWDADAKEMLTHLLEDGNHVGEIGLDSKRGNVNEQFPAFEDQLALGSETDRICSIHMIGTEKEVLDTLRGLGKSVPRVILHSYGSDSYVKPFAEIGCYMSVSPRILSRSDVRVSRLLGAIPRDRLLLETDAPHSGRGFSGMGDFTARIAALMGTDAGTLAGNVFDNLRNLIG